MRNSRNVLRISRAEKSTIYKIATNSSESLKNLSCFNVTLQSILPFPRSKVREGRLRERHVNTGNPRESIPGSRSIGLAPESAESLLREVIHLLEEYAPAWYTEELHNRAKLVLGDVFDN